jgi:hypothetical protein
VRPDGPDRGAGFAARLDDAEPREAGRGEAARVEDDRVLAGAFERLVGEDPDRPDPDEGRGGAGERVAMA